MTMECVAAVAVLAMLVMAFASGFVSGYVAHKKNLFKWKGK